MQNILSIQRSFSDQSHQEMASRIRFLDQKVKDLEKQIEQLTRSYITIPMVHGNEVIKINKIVYCQASSNYTNIYLADGRRVCVSKTLKYIQSLLSDQKFIRIHQSYLVSIQFIREYQLGSRPRVELITSETLSISKTGAKRIQEVFCSKHKSKPTTSKRKITIPYSLKLLKN